MVCSSMSEGGGDSPWDNFSRLSLKKTALHTCSSSFKVSLKGILNRDGFKPLFDCVLESNLLSRLHCELNEDPLHPLKGAFEAPL